jgi:hypothetical protein
MKNLLRFLAFVLMVGSACAQSIPQRASTELISDCFLLFSKGINDKLAYWEISGFRNKAFAIGVPSSGLQACQYQYGGALRYSNDEIKELAITECNKRMPTGTGCVLYATNNEIIYDKESHQRQLNHNNTKEQASVANHIVATATAQPDVTISNLPACQGRVPANWSYCYGSTEPYRGGNKYSGEFINGEYNGLGTFYFNNGNKYVGQFKNALFNGQGTLYASNGSIINRGMWSNDRFVSSAPLQQASSLNQTVATAMQQPNISQSDLPACQGSDIARWSNCFGTYTFPDGAKYVGEWKAMLMHGRGTFTSAIGVKYEGEWKDNYYNGQGTLFASNGSVISQGTWADGKFVRSASQLESLPSVLSNNAEIDRLTAEVEGERKKRQELEAQLAASVQPTPPQTNTLRRTAHALVIGNGAYPGSGRLDNPVNDANAISQKLRSMGFIVTTVTDANRQRLVQSMAQFRRTAASADISLLYYAGHGVQIFGTNYILPTDVDQTDPAQATIQGVSLNSVVENFLPGKTKLVFLDACRDNALQRTNDRSVSKGLAPISAAEGTLISYATKDGQTAADGVGSKNSPFTQALLEHLNDPQDIAVVLRKVRERVMKITGGKQQPWKYGSLTGGELVLSAIKPK